MNRYETVFGRRIEGDWTVSGTLRLTYNGPADATASNTETIRALMYVVQTLTRRLAEDAAPLIRLHCARCHRPHRLDTEHAGTRRETEGLCADCARR